MTSLNDWRPVALTPIASPLRGLSTSHLCYDSSTLHPLHFCILTRGREGAIDHVLHTALSHLEGKHTYVRMLFVNCSPTFNTIVFTLVRQLKDLGLNKTLCDWILDFLMECQQVVKKRQQHLFFTDPQCWSATGLFPQFPPVSTLHPWPLGNTNI